MLFITRRFGEEIQLGTETKLRVIALAAHGCRVSKVIRGEFVDVEVLEIGRVYAAHIDGHKVTIEIESVQRGQARFAIDAPKAVIIRALDPEDRNGS